MEESTAQTPSPVLPQIVPPQKEPPQPPEPNTAPPPETKPGKKPLVFIVMAILIMLALAYGLLTRITNRPALPDQQSSPTPKSISENTHQAVFLEIVDALESNDPKKLYDKLAPSMKKFLVTYDKLLESFNDTSRVTKITIITDSELKVGDEWGINKWADGKVEITREKTTTQYVIRLINEEGQWWLFASIELTDDTEKVPLKTGNFENPASNESFKRLSELEEVKEWTKLVKEAGNKVVFVIEDDCSSGNEYCFIVAVKEDLEDHQTVFNRYKVREEGDITKLDITGKYLPL